MANISSIGPSQNNALQAPVEQPQEQVKDGAKAQAGGGKVDAKEAPQGKAPEGTGEVAQKRLGTGVTAQVSVDGVQKLDQAQVVSLLQSLGVQTHDVGSAANKSTAVASFDALKSLLGTPPKGVKIPEGFASVPPQDAAPAAKTLSTLSNLLSQTKLAEFLQTGESKDPESWKALVSSMHEQGLIPGETARLTTTERSTFANKLEALAQTLLDAHATAGATPNLPAEVLKKFEAAFPAIQSAILANDPKKWKEATAKLEAGLKKGAGLIGKLPAGAQLAMKQALQQLLARAPEALQAEIKEALANAKPDLPKLVDSVSQWIGGHSEQEAASLADAAAQLVVHMHDVGLAAASAADVSPQLKNELQATFTLASRAEYQALFSPAVEIPAPAIVKLESALAPAVQALRMGSAQRMVEGNAPAGASFAPVIGVDIDNASIDALIMWVMSQCRKTDTDILRDQMKEMQELNKQKKAQREHINHLKAERAEVKNDQRQIFDTLQSQGVIKSDVKFEDFQAWCPVAWDEKGNASIAAPLPNPPASMLTDPPTAPAAPSMEALPLPEGVAPLSQEEVTMLCEKYGVAPDDIIAMYSIYASRIHDGVYFSKVNGKDPGPVSVAGFEKMLTWPSLTTPKLKPANGDPKIVEENQKKVEDFQSNFHGTLGAQIKKENEAIAEQKKVSEEAAKAGGSIGEAVSDVVDEVSPIGVAVTGGKLGEVKPGDPIARAEALLHPTKVSDKDLFLFLDQLCVENPELGQWIEDCLGVKPPYSVAVMSKIAEWMTNALNNEVTPGAYADATVAASAMLEKLFDKGGSHCPPEMQLIMEEMTNRFLNTVSPFFSDVWQSSMQQAGKAEALGNTIAAFNASIEARIAATRDGSAADVFGALGSELSTNLGKAPINTGYQPMGGMGGVMYSRYVSASHAADTWANDGVFFGGITTAEMNKAMQNKLEALRKAPKPAAEEEKKTEPEKPAEPPKPSMGPVGAKLTLIDQIWSSNSAKASEFRDAWSSYQAESASYQENYALGMSAANSVAAQRMSDLDSNYKTGSLEMFDAQVESMETAMDTMSDLTTTKQQRLQIWMDQIAKLSETMSNIMKKMSETLGTITQNIK